jgi:hypothetical protein
MRLAVLTIKYSYHPTALNLARLLPLMKAVKCCYSFLISVSKGLPARTVTFRVNCVSASRKVPIMRTTSEGSC